MALQRLLQRCSGLLLQPAASLAPLEAACRSSLSQQGEGTAWQPSCGPSQCSGEATHGHLPSLPARLPMHAQHRHQPWPAAGSTKSELPAGISTPPGWQGPCHAHLWSALQHASSFFPSAHRAPCPHMLQLRGYKSIKKSMKPIYARASRLAVQPYLDPSASTSQPDPRQKAWQEALRAAPIIDTALSEIPSVPEPPEFRRVGRITGEYSLSLQPMFSVVQIRGTQFKVTTDDIVFVSHIKEVAVNEVLSLDRVMLIGSLNTTIIGRPYVPQACVLVAVEEHFQDGEVHVFKFKKRNRYKKYHTARQNLTALRVLHVVEDTNSDQAQVTVTRHVPISWYPDLAAEKEEEPEEEEQQQQQQQAV